MRLRLTLFGLVLTIMLCCQMAQANVVINSVIQTEEICNLSNGTLTINATGPSGVVLFYSIDGGITFQESNFFDNLESDDFLVTVTDGTVCSEDFTAQVTSAALPIISVEVNCIEGSGLTDIDLMPFPTGIPPYTFDWVGPAGTYSTEDLTAVPSGAYSVLVSDAFGCTVDTSFIVEICCGFNMACSVDTSFLSCIGDYTEYTSDTFLTLNNIDKISLLDNLFGIDVNAIPCSDLEVEVTNVVESDMDCNTPMIVTTTIVVSDEISTFVCVKTYSIENYLGVGVISDAENLVVDCGSNVENLLQQFISESGGAEFSSCSSFDILTSPVSPEIDFSCDGGGLVDIVFYIVDDCGNIDSTAASFIVEDILPPTLEACADDITIDSESDVPAELEAWFGQVVANDACSNVTVTSDLDLSNLPSDCDGLSSTVLFTIADDCDNFVTCNAELLISSVGTPTITCPEDITIECGPSLTTEALAWIDLAEGLEFDGSPISVDNDFDNQVLDDISCDGELSVGFSISNGCEEASCMSVLSVIDTRVPLLDCPEPLDVDYDASSINDLISDWTNSVVASDDCGLMSVESDYDASGLVLDCQGSELIVVFVATDICGNTVDCLSMINVIGGQGGNINCPSDLNIDCAEANVEAVIANWATQVTADDGAGNTLVVANDFDVNNFNEISCGEELPVIFSAAADCLDLECAVVISIIDNEDPKISCPDETTLDFNAADFEVKLDEWIASVEVLDNCAAIQIENDFEFDIEIPCGESLTVVVTYTATDGCDNSATCEASVNLAVPAALPNVDCPSVLVLTCIDDVSLVDDWLTTGIASNDQGVLLELSNDFDASLLSDLSCGDEVDVTFEAVDACGTVDCQSTISFLDAESPTISCPTSLMISTSNSAPEDEVLSWLESYQAADNCQLGEVQSDFNLSVLSNLCDVTDPIQVEFVVSDVCGNIDACQTELSVSSGAIIMSCPAELTLECGDSGFDSSLANWLAEGQAETSDGVELVVINNLSSELTPSCNDDIIVTFQSADNCGQANSCTSTVKILDTQVPTIVCPSDLILTEYTNLEVQVNEWLAEVSGEDNCSAVTLLNDFDFELEGVGCPVDLEVNFDAADECQNRTTCTSRLSVGEASTLAISCPETLELGCSEVEPDSLINRLLSLIEVESSTTFDLDYSYSIDIFEIGCDFIYEFEAKINAYGDCDQEVECRVSISVEPEAQVYIPNVFKPIGRAARFLTVYANPVIEEVEEFYVFDRWGERVFESFNFLPNDETSGWDGRFNGVVSQSNVYTYYAVLRSVTGEQLKYSGDVTLLK